MHDIKRAACRFGLAIAEGIAIEVFILRKESN
jgi:hypothetical protein